MRCGSAVLALSLRREFAQLVVDSSDAFLCSWCPPDLAGMLARGEGPPNIGGACSGEAGVAVAGGPPAAMCVGGVAGAWCSIAAPMIGVGDEMFTHPDEYGSAVAMLIVAA